MRPLPSRPTRASANNISRFLCSLLCGSLFLAAAAAATAVAQSGISYRSSATANTGAGASSITVNKPAGTVTNDVMIANLFVRGLGTTPSVTAPAGWTLIREDFNANSMLSYYRAAGASEPANYTWTFDSSRPAVAVISSYSGVSTSAPVDAHNGQMNLPSTTITAPSVTTTVANTMLVGCFGLLEGGQSISPAAGMTERVDTSPAGPNLTLEMSDELRAASGATGARDATASFSDTSFGQLIALKPAGGGGNNPPTVSIDSPANNATFTAPANITIDATASDTEGGTVTQVEFFQGTTSLNVDTSLPYSYTWSNVSAGSYTLTAKATDNGGATTTSAAVNVTVNGSTGGGSGWTDTGAAVVLTDASDRVGVGTANPATNLHVVGATASQNQHLMVENYATGARLQLRRANGSLAAPTAIAGGDILGNIGFSGYGANGWHTNNLGLLRGTAAETFTDTASGTHLSILTTPTGTTSQLERMRFEANGNVGVGTATPAYRLDVQGGQLNVSGGLCIAGDCKTAWSQVGGGTGSQWTTADSAIHYNAGNVGIGTPNPGVALEVGQNKAIRLGNANISSGGDHVNLSNHAWYNGSGWQFDGMVGGLYQISGQAHNWYKHDGSSFTNTMTINANGNVGIGTATPAEKLDIAGNIKVTGPGNITAAGTITGGVIEAKYQDVAEWVESSQELPAGTVVVLDHTKSNQVVASTQAYDTRVAGVISARPGIVLGESGAAKVLVATTGRVRIKVDATRAPIQVGDLLVTGDREGFAMKSLPVSIGGVLLHRPGTLVGKALEPLAEGTGEILVLLSLQ